LHQLQASQEPVIIEEVVFMKRREMLAELKGSGFPTRTRYCLRVESGYPEIPKMCILNHECYHCAFDQWMDAMEDSEITLLAEAA
jgi:hypothetical protein